MSNPSGLQITVLLKRRDFTLDLDLDLPGNGISALFGASGSGKTTALRVLAGLEPGATGRICVQGEVWQDSAKAIFKPVHQRALGYVFQEASLFEHLNVQANLQYGFKRTPAPQRNHHWDHTLDLLGITHLLSRWPHELSGGERQRVAIARALVTRPACVLADEPTGNLDRNTADGVFELMLDLARTHGTAFVLVTHDHALAACCQRQLTLVQGKLTETT